MLTICKSFLSRRYLFFVVLLACMGASAAMLALGFMTFDREFTRRLARTEIGAIPRVQVIFKTPVESRKLRRLAGYLTRDLAPDYLYCGNFFAVRARFAWDKYMGTSSGEKPAFDELTYHDFDIQLLAVQPPDRIALEVDDGSGSKWVRCLKIAPFKVRGIPGAGLFISEKEARKKKLGNRLRLRRGRAGFLLARTVDLRSREYADLPELALADGGETVDILGLACRRYWIPPCPAGQDECNYLEKVEIPAEAALACILTRLLFCQMGQPFWNSLPEEPPDKLCDRIDPPAYAWRVFEGERFHALYSQELWQYIKGKSLRGLDHMQFKILGREGGGPFSRPPVAINSAGWFYAHYRPGAGGRVLLVSRERLKNLDLQRKFMGAAGKLRDGYNYLALDKVGIAEKALCRTVLRNCEEAGIEAREVSIVPLSRLVGGRSLAFIETGGRLIVAFGGLMVACCMVMYFLAARRLGRNLDENWDKLYLIGATRGQRLFLDALLVAIELGLGFFLVSTMFFLVRIYCESQGAIDPDFYVKLCRDDLVVVLVIYGSLVVVGRLLPSIFRWGKIRT